MHNLKNTNINVLSTNKRINYEDKFKYLIYHDKLTGVYNREFLDQFFKQLEEKDFFPISFIVGNLDSLKIINKKYGRKYGDQVIIETAKILEDLIDKNDYLIRIDGDEFLIIMLNKNLNKIDSLLEKIDNFINKKVIKTQKISIGLGSAIYSEPTQNIENVLSKALSNMHLNKLSKSESTKNQVIESMVNTLEAKSYETNAHAERMGKLAVRLGKRVNLSKRELDELKLLADLHDIGKVAIPESILKKPTNLTKEEFEIIKKHPQTGFDIVNAIPELYNVAKGVLAHHERWDGEGYPYGLKENEIPILARIITIVDSFDVMINKRSYKEAYTYNYAIKELKKCAGSQFDPMLIEEFLKLIINKPFDLEIKMDNIKKLV